MLPKPCYSEIIPRVHQRKPFSHWLRHKSLRMRQMIKRSFIESRLSLTKKQETNYNMNNSSHKPCGCMFALLIFVSFEKRCWCCVLNWYIQHTLFITFPLISQELTHNPLFALFVTLEVDMVNPFMPYFNVGSGTYLLFFPS